MSDVDMCDFSHYFSSNPPDKVLGIINKKRDVMAKVVETKHGLVAFVESDEYFNGDIMRGSMGSIAKETGAKYVLILGDKVKYDDVGVEKAEELVEMVLSATTHSAEVGDE